MHALEMPKRQSVLSAVRLGLALLIVSLAALEFFSAMLHHATLERLTEAGSTSNGGRASFLPQKCNRKNNHNTTSQSMSISPARQVVRAAYRDSYKHLVDDCGSDDKKRQSNCMRQLLLHNNNETNALPWWFYTLLRDAKPLASANWHYLDAPVYNATHRTPPLSMCTMEKVATTQWRLVFDRLIGRNNYLYQRGRPDEHIIRRNYTWTVLRDPLERFLSAYLNKCFEELRRGFCKPNVIFREPASKEDKLSSPNEKYATVLEESPQAHFEAFVDTMPLRWDLHFLPQAITCGGLYRYMYQYDTVLYMGDDFQSELGRLGNRIGGAFPEILRDVFPAPSKDQVARTGGYHSTGSSAKLTKYYTPRSLRKVLQYASIDYVTLNLTIPDWADAMLRQEEQNSGN